MDKSDVEMDEVKQRIQVTVNNELETENKLPDAKVDCREGEFLTKAVMDDVNAGANVSEDLKFTEGEAKDDKNEAEHQINISSETKDPIKGKSEAVDPIESESEHNIFGSGVEEEKNSMVNGIEVASPVENMIEEDKVNGDVAKEKISNENSRRDGNPVENVGVEEKPRENAATEETSIKVNQLPTELSANEASQNEVNLVDDTPNSLVKCLPSKAVDHGREMFKTIFSQAKMAEGDDGTPEDQKMFMKALENFHREKGMDFKPPKFYGHPLNCLKLWRAVIQLGGYDRVTGSKLWRQVGESFHPPKTCTTVSWTFRIFYEKTLLEFERHKTQSGELQLPVVSLPEVFDNELIEQGNGYQGSGRARRDAAARAMQGWHAQRLFGSDEVDEPILKDKNLSTTAKHEKTLKGPLKQKRLNEMELPVKAARTETYKQLVTTVVDVGPPADWVKINICETNDSFEVYALVPGLLREEVRVQSDPAGRLVITGHPEEPDNPWGVTPFRKVVSLPARIDPVHTTAVVSLHGRLFVRVPFEQSTT
ncbi:AT-rich interactive domain-containing protein 6-like isoform X3 [Olea europaea var. sylvestris]|uniref:AT-rich interactive domain-containing protein 6-like isoform X3 n=1 Tax=Olea europaea var. sylvestris TaxID=158386 RepID=UPI000C1CE523|nr:AT-rich interactive domain-containing protein 6-like isoform X3 [Olea europaea var. sylvestris]